MCHNPTETTSARHLRGMTGWSLSALLCNLFSSTETKFGVLSTCSASCGSVEVIINKTTALDISVISVLMFPLPRTFCVLI